MRDLIRKILREDESEMIKRREEHNKKKLPSIIRYIEETYGDSVRYKVDSRRIGYVSEPKTIRDCVQLNIYVEDDSLLPSDVRAGIIFDLKNIFRIDLNEFGSCFFLNVYQKRWEEV